MNASKLITTSVAALTVVGAGLVYAQTAPATPPGSTAAPGELQGTQAQPTTPPAESSTTTPSTGMTPPSQDTVQRSDTMAPDAQADRN
jgi:hypothetical protein